MYVPTTIRIAIMPSNPNKEGLVPLVIRFIQNRKVNNIYLRKYIPLTDWINAKGVYVKERKSSINNPRELNLFLQKQLAKAEKILLDAEIHDQPITFHQFKARYVATEENIDFIAFCEGELEKRKKSEKYSKQTLISNWARLNKLKRFRSFIAFYEIDIAFLEAYEKYLRVECNNDVNTIFAVMKFIRTMLNAARKAEVTEVYPFSQYSLKYKKDTRDRLNIEEINALQRMYDANTLNDSWQRVLQLFLFSTYTGLSWGDLETLDYKHIQSSNKSFVIYKKRKKTGTPFIVPLIKQARNLIDLTQSAGKVFPKIINNSKANKLIKEIVAKSNVTYKRVSFHVGRHSFATIAINSKIPKEVIKRILGHAGDSTITDLYAKVQDQYVIDEMRKLDANLSDATFKEHFDEYVLAKYKKLRIQLISTRIAEGHSELDAALVIGVSEREYKQMEKGEVQFGLRIGWLCGSGWE